MLTNLSATNTIISEWIRELRDVQIQADRMRFRKNLERIGAIAAYEISKHLPYKQISVPTPLGTAACSVLATQPVLATILRAGLPLYEGLLNFFDKADTAFIGAYRKHGRDGAFGIHQSYVASAPIEGRPLIIADTMLATGASLALAIKTLTEWEQPSQLHIVTVIASTAGINYVGSAFPHAHIWAGATDNNLSDNGYIIPGLGDAGDLAYGEKMQS